jgi:hypothetical protein
VPAVAVHEHDGYVRVDGWNTIATKTHGLRWSVDVDLPRLRSLHDSSCQRGGTHQIARIFFYLALFSPTKTKSPAWLARRRYSPLLTFILKEQAKDKKRQADRRCCQGDWYKSNPPARQQARFTLCCRRPSNGTIGFAGETCAHERDARFFLPSLVQVSTGLRSIQTGISRAHR